MSFFGVGSVKTPYPVQKLLKSVLVLFSPLKDLKVCLTFDFIVGFQRILWWTRLADSDWLKVALHWLKNHKLDDWHNHGWVCSMGSKQDGFDFRTRGRPCEADTIEPRIRVSEVDKHKVFVGCICHSIWVLLTSNLQRKFQLTETETMWSTSELNNLLIIMILVYMSCTQCRIQPVGTGEKKQGVFLSVSAEQSSISRVESRFHCAS